MASQRDNAQGKQDGIAEEAWDAAPGGTEANQASSSAPATVITHLNNGAGEPDGEAAGRPNNKRKHDEVGGGALGGDNPVVASRHTSLRAHVESMIDTVRPHLLAMLEDVDCVYLWLELLMPKQEDATNVGLDALCTASSDVSRASVRL